MQPKATLGKAARSLGTVFFALTLLLAAVAIGFGGTALFIYHQLGTSEDSARQAADRAAAAQHLTGQRHAPADTAAQPRQVALTQQDRPSYSYADNVNGQPSTPAPRPRSAPTNVPAPLGTPAATPAAVASNAPYLSDPESRFIYDARTGRVIGVDGSAGAAAEERQQQEELLRSAPRAVAVQTPAPEVRVAVPVMEENQPVYADTVPTAATPAPGSQYVPVRKALPVNDTPTASTFSVADELSDDRPVLRAQLVLVSSRQR